MNEGGGMTGENDSGMKEERDIESIEWPNRTQNLPEKIL